MRVYVYGLWECRPYNKLANTPGQLEEAKSYVGAFTTWTLSKLPRPLGVVRSLSFRVCFSGHFLCTLPFSELPLSDPRREKPRR